MYKYPIERVVTSNYPLLENWWVPWNSWNLWWRCHSIELVRQTLGASTFERQYLCFWSSNKRVRKQTHKEIWNYYSFWNRWNSILLSKFSEFTFRKETEDIFNRNTQNTAAAKYLAERTHQLSGTFFITFFMFKNCQSLSCWLFCIKSIILS